MLRRGPDSALQMNSRTALNLIRFNSLLIRVNLGDGEEGMAAYVEPFVILLILFINGCVAIW